jgi:site-specific DNA-methyltransferase (adenine-specific)
MLQSVISQDVTQQCFRYVPLLEKYQGEYSDDILRKRWNVTDEQWGVIDSRIKLTNE